MIQEKSYSFNYVPTKGWKVSNSNDRQPLIYLILVQSLYQIKFPGTQKGEKPQSQYSQLLKRCARCNSPRSTQPTSTPVRKTPSVVHIGCYKLIQLYVLRQTWLWFMAKPKDKTNDYKNCILPSWQHSVPSAPLSLKQLYLLRFSLGITSLRHWSPLPSAVPHTSLCELLLTFYSRLYFKMTDTLAMLCLLIKLFIWGTSFPAWLLRTAPIKT